jgi:hypothetical protein
VRILTQYDLNQTWALNYFNNVGDQIFLLVDSDGGKDLDYDILNSIRIHLPSDMLLTINALDILVEKGYPMKDCLDAIVSSFFFRTVFPDFLSKALDVGLMDLHNEVKLFMTAIELLHKRHS